VLSYNSTPRRFWNNLVSEGIGHEGKKECLWSKIRMCPSLGLDLL